MNAISFLAEFQQDWTFVNYLPARLAALLLFAAIGLAHLSVRQAWLALRRDARRHLSPNSGIPEAMDHGVASQRGTMGEARCSLVSNDICNCIPLGNEAAVELELNAEIKYRKYEARVLVREDYTRQCRTRCSCSAL